jgi:hypothetical protein
MILLFNRAGGSSVPVHHADCASGELLDLCTAAVDAASTTITSVTSTSFQIGSGAATGTYDYLVCSELSGLFDLGKYVGNASSDGPYCDVTGKPAAVWVKRRDVSVGQWNAHDTTRSTYNPSTHQLALNATTAEDTVYLIDLLSSAIKPRIGAGYAMNESASEHLTMTWLAASNKYALAR